MGDVLQGDERGASPTQAGKNVYQALHDYGGGLQRFVNQGVDPYEQALMGANSKFGGSYQKLFTNLYSKFAPKYANTQQGLADIAAKGELNRFGNYGLPAVGMAAGAARSIDPEYYATRGNLSNNLRDFMNSPLGENEYEAITRGVNRMNQGAGLGEIAGIGNTAANAQLYGNAARNRQAQGLQMGGSILPSLQSVSPTDIYGMGSSVGKGTYNPNLQSADTSKVTGQGATNVMDMYNGLLGSQNIKAQIDANRRTATDFVSSNWSAGVGSILGCWVAREVFGADNLQWLEFREWMFHKAPKWFYNLYMKFGASFAKWLQNKPRIKRVIRLWMESKIRNYHATTA